MSASKAWKRFGTNNGARSLMELINRTSNYAQKHSKHQQSRQDPQIGCILLRECIFLGDGQFYDPASYGFLFHKNVVKLKYYKNADRIPTDTTTPFPSDIGDEPGGSQRAETITYRILRDTNLARKLKTLHSDRWQICGESINLGKSRTYSEAHHIRPLGDPHSGPDVGGNIIVLCPNHHAICDYGGIRLIKEELRQLDGHRIQQEFIDYHNKNIY